MGVKVGCRKQLFVLIRQRIYLNYMVPGRNNDWKFKEICLKSEDDESLGFIILQQSFGNFKETLILKSFLRLYG